MSHKDMEFAELRRFAQETVRRAYRVHKSQLGDADDVNRANAEAGPGLPGAQWDAGGS
jgi:capsid portal protein